MSSWIERELERERQTRDQERRRKEAVRKFWPRIRERFQSDVGYFNKHCPPDRSVTWTDDGDSKFSVSPPGDAGHSIALWLESEQGLVQCLNQDNGEAQTVDLRLEVNGEIEYANLLGDDACLKLAQDLLKPLLFPGR